MDFLSSTDPNAVWLNNARVSETLDKDGKIINSYETIDVRDPAINTKYLMLVGYATV